MAECSCQATEGHLRVASYGTSNTILSDGPQAGRDRQWKKFKTPFSYGTKNTLQALLLNKKIANAYPEVRLLQY